MLGLDAGVQWIDCRLLRGQFTALSRGGQNDKSTPDENISTMMEGSSSLGHNLIPAVSYTEENTFLSSGCYLGSYCTHCPWVITAAPVAVAQAHIHLE